MSDRMRKQVNLFNLIDDWERFFAQIIVYDIAGKMEAKLLETEYDCFIFSRSVVLSRIAVSLC